MRMFAGGTALAVALSAWCHSRVTSMEVGSRRTSKGHSRVRRERVGGSSAYTGCRRNSQEGMK